MPNKTEYFTMADQKEKNFIWHTRPDRSFGTCFVLCNLANAYPIAIYFCFYIVHVIDFAILFVKQNKIVGVIK